MGAIASRNHQPHRCLLNRLFGRRSKKTSKLRVTGLCVGNSPGTGEFPAQMASNAESVSIWWRHHETVIVVWITEFYIKLKWLDSSDYEGQIDIQVCEFFSGHWVIMATVETNQLRAKFFKVNINIYLHFYHSSTLIWHRYLKFFLK